MAVILFGGWSLFYSPTFKHYSSMKWFKHFSTAMDDLFVKDLERKFSDAGYAFWFKTLELIAAYGENGKLTISWTNYQEKLHKRRTQVEELLNFCSTSGKLIWKGVDQNVIIECKKFAEFSDNYTKYGIPTSKRLQRDFKETSKQEGEEEVDKKEKKNKDIVDLIPSTSFDIIWALYPNRQGKKNALRHFTATVKTQSDFRNIQLALSNYLHSFNVSKGFIKNGSTWFNEWQDWISPTSVMMKGSNGSLSQAAPSVRFEQCQFCREKFSNIKTHLDACNKNPKNKITGTLPPEVKEAADLLKKKFQASCKTCGRAKDNPIKCRDKYHQS